MVVPSHAWFYQQPKQWLSNCCTTWGLPAPVFRTSSADGGLWLSLLRFPLAVTARQVELADSVTKRHQLTPAVQEAGGNKKDAETACAREACRQLDALGLLHRKKPAAWPAWLPRNGGGDGAPPTAHGAKSAHRRVTEKPPSLAPGNVATVAAKRHMDADEIGWLRLQWYGKQPKQWFSNSHQIFRLPPPSFNTRDETVATASHTCSVQLPAAVSRRLHTGSAPCMASARSKKEAEALCALKGCWLLDQAGFLARNNGRSAPASDQQILPPPPLELSLPRELATALEAALEGVGESWRSRFKFHRIDASGALHSSSSSSDSDSDSSDSESDDHRSKKKRKHRGEKKKTKKHKHKKKKQGKEKKKSSSSKRSKKRSRHSEEPPLQEEQPQEIELELTVALPGAGTGNATGGSKHLVDSAEETEQRTSGIDREAALRQQLLSSLVAVGGSAPAAAPPAAPPAAAPAAAASASASSNMVRFLERKEREGTLSVAQQAALQSAVVSATPTANISSATATELTVQQTKAAAAPTVAVTALASRTAGTAARVPSVKLSPKPSPKPQADSRRHTPTTTSNPRMAKHRSALPVYARRTEVLECIGSHRVVVISGPTGSGKTTQLPQFLLEHAAKTGVPCQVVVTQPRRLACVAVAERVANERGEQIGTAVGYSIRLESVVPTAPDNVVFCTTGVMLRRLMAARTGNGAGGIGGGRGDTGDDQRSKQAQLALPMTHLVLDEVHERDLHSDFVLTVVRELLPFCPQLRLILMSATVDTERFVNYFDGVVGPCAHFGVEGRMFPVKALYLDDLDAVPALARIADDTLLAQRGRDGQDNSAASMPLDLASAMVEYLHTSRPLDGAILVFLPGWGEILTVTRLLEKLQSVRTMSVIPLHGNLQGSSNSKVFERPRPGFRKVVLSTNIAETSVTIDDVVCESPLLFLRPSLWPFVDFRPSR